MENKSANKMANRMGSDVGCRMGSDVDRGRTKPSNWNILWGAGWGRIKPSNWNILKKEPNS